MLTMSPTDERALVEAFLDGLMLGRLERQRDETDFPRVPSPTDEYSTGWPYSDTDDAP
mgnify:CR=1 FL=1